MIVTATEVQNNFGKYLKLAENEDILISKNGKVIARLASCENKLDYFVVRETAENYNHAGMKVSYEEFLEISEKSENRYEYIDGEIYLLASPLYDHQKAVMGILGEFISWFRNKPCEPLVAPFDVTLIREDREDNKINVVQPDILVMCDHEKINEKGRYMGVPTLVVEVISESTRSKDLTRKLDLYTAAGVQEYWVVNTRTKEIYVYTAKTKALEEIYTFKGSDRVESVAFRGLGIDLKQVFA